MHLTGVGMVSSWHGCLAIGGLIRIQMSPWNVFYSLVFMVIVCVT